MDFVHNMEAIMERFNILVPRVMDLELWEESRAGV